MATIYELTAEYEQLLEMLEDEEVDQEVLSDTLEAIDGEIEDKADSYARIIVQMEADKEAMEKEAERLVSRTKVYDDRIKWLKYTLKNAMIATGKRKFKTALFSFNIAKNGGKRKLVVDVDVEKLPEAYRIKQPDKVDNDTLREYLGEKGVLQENGSITCEYAHLEPQGESLRIK